jgi:hypothetical protein
MHAATWYRPIIAARGTVSRMGPTLHGRSMPPKMKQCKRKKGVKLSCARIFAVDCAFVLRCQSNSLGIVRCWSRRPELWCVSRRRFSSSFSLYLSHDLLPLIFFGKCFSSVFFCPLSLFCTFYVGGAHGSRIIWGSLASRFLSHPPMRVLCVCVCCLMTA